MTIHLFSSIGMGERPEITGADSHGRIWGFDNLHVNDASLLPDAPGVNPQGTIMAIASRNCEHFLETR
jgi:choline dehydrogenase-like flavoprotein